jgi:GT2 family glycosyltransferase/glycosyltransferase involved in cell wall biosynthesis
MGSQNVPNVVTVVVTFNGLADTVACLGSLLETTYPRHEIVVVDNGSTGEAEAILARFGTAVAAIEAGGNVGFGAGANLGIAWALSRGADYVWVLNNDTVVPAETVERLVRAMESDRRIGIASPQITAPEGPEAPGGIWFAGGLVDLRRGSTRHLTAPLAAERGAVPSAFLTGCALMLRAETLAEVGTFWERLFLYWEDTDLDLRVQRAGWTTCVVADAWIRHEVHAATPGDVVAYYHFRNALLVAWRHAGLAGFAGATAHLTYAVARRWASAALGRRPAPLPETRGLLRGIGTALLWTVRAPEDARLPPPAAEPGSGPRAAQPGRPLAVLHVVRRYAPLIGGTETYVRDLAEAQVRAGRRVTVLTLDHDVTGVYRGRLPATEERAGVRVVRLPGIGARRFAITSRPWRLAGEVFRADVVHLHDIRFMTGTTSLAARVRRRGLILHTHGLIFHTQWAARLKRFLVRSYYGPVLRLTQAAIVASSKPDREALLALAPYLARRLVLLENAIRLEGLLALPRKPAPGRVLAFGRVARSKSLDALFGAVATIPGVGWELCVAGAEEPAERDRLEQIATRLGIRERIRFQGPFSDAEFGELLAGADVAVFPSAGEGFGLALLEAMAAAVPVLANDIPAHRALLGPDLAANLADFAHPSEAGAAIARLLELPARARLALGQKERTRAEEYDIARLVRDVDRLYESLGVRS